MIADDKLEEYAKEYNDEYYGVAREELARVARGKKIGIWRIEYQGVLTVKDKYPEIKSILIAPQSLEILEQRIRRRDKNASEDFIRNRMEYSKEFLKHENIYDYKVVNAQGKLDEAVQEVATIIKNNQKT